MIQTELEGGVFVGRGWHFPVQASVTGGIAMVVGVEEIEQSIFLILATHPGERPMRPEFGTPLADFVFEPVNGRTLGRIAFVVGESLRRWEPRITVESIDVEPDPENHEVLLIDVGYTIRGDYDRRNLLVPFYNIPEEG